MKKLLYTTAVAAILFVACKKDADTTSVPTSNTTSNTTTDLTPVEITAALAIVAQPVAVNAHGDSTIITKNSDGTVTRVYKEIDGGYLDATWTTIYKIDGTTQTTIVDADDTTQTFVFVGKLQKDGVLKSTTTDELGTIEYLINPDNSHKEVATKKITDSINGEVTYIETVEHKPDGTFIETITADGKLVFKASEDINGIETDIVYDHDTIVFTNKSEPSVRHQKRTKSCGEPYCVGQVFWWPKPWEGLFIFHSPGKVDFMGYMYDTFLILIYSKGGYTLTTKHKEDIGTFTEPSTRIIQKVTFKKIE